MTFKNFYRTIALPFVLAGSLVLSSCVSKPRNPVVSENSSSQIFENSKSNAKDDKIVEDDSIGSLISQIEAARGVMGEGGEGKLFSEGTLIVHYLDRVTYGYMFTAALDPAILYENPFTGENETYVHFFSEHDGARTLGTSNYNFFSLYDGNFDGEVEKLVLWNGNWTPNKTIQREDNELFKNADSLIKLLNGRYRLKDIDDLYHEFYLKD